MYAKNERATSKSPSLKELVQRKVPDNSKRRIRYTVPSSETKGNTIKYNVFEPARTRFSTSAKRGLNTTYSPAREVLKTRFDVAEELVEETKEITPTKKTFLGSSGKKSWRTTHSLTPNEQDEFVATLRDLVDLDKELEEAKQVLALRPDFTLEDGFRVFDYHKFKFSSIDEIIDAFERFRIYPTRDQAKLFLTRYDIDKDGKLDYSEF